MSYTKLTDFAAKDALLSGNPSKLLRGTEIGAEFDAIESAMAVAEAVNITAPIIAASTSKTTPVDADVLPILDSAAANILKKVTWANIKATLKTYFDTLYAAVGSFAASGANADITSLTALTAGGLPDNSVLTADIAALQVTGAKIAAATITPDKLSGAQSGSAPIYGARAWCQFDGTLTGTNAPTAGGNVSSVTRNAAGDYTITFATVMPDANYAVSLCGPSLNGRIGFLFNGTFNNGDISSTKLAGSFRIVFADPATGNSSAIEGHQLTVVIYR